MLWHVERKCSGAPDLCRHHELVFSYLHNDLWKKVLVKENIFKKSIALTHLHYCILHQKSISCLQPFRVEMLLIFSILCTNIRTHMIIPEKLNICLLPDNPILYWKKIKHLEQNIAQWNCIYTSEYCNRIASISKLLVHSCRKQEDNDILRNSPLLFSWICHLIPYLKSIPVTSESAALCSGYFQSPLNTIRHMVNISWQMNKHSASFDPSL